MRARVITVGVALCVACKGSEREVPKPPLAGVRVVDLIPVSLSGESWQDAEPFLALYAANPRLMAASAFTPNPGGSASATAPIFVSDDGGDSWTLRNTLPSQTMTADITHAVGGNPPVLYAGIMKVPDFPLNELKANDLFSPATMILQGFRADIDQPFVRTSAVGNADRVYIGLNDFDAPDGRTATWWTPRTTSPAASWRPTSPSPGRTRRRWDRSASGPPCRSRWTRSTATTCTWRGPTGWGRATSTRFTCGARPTAARPGAATCAP